MAPQIGRPRVANPKSVEVKVRFDKDKNREILNYCERNGISRTDMIRQGIDLLLKSEKK